MRLSPALVEDLLRPPLGCLLPSGLFQDDEEHHERCGEHVLDVALCPQPWDLEVQVGCSSPVPPCVGAGVLAPGALIPQQDLVSAAGARDDDRCIWGVIRFQRPGRWPKDTLKTTQLVRLAQAAGTPELRPPR